MNFTRPFNVIPRIVACNSITLSSSLNSGQLHKNKDHRKNGKIYDFHQIFMKYKGNKKLIVYAISYEPKSTRSLNKISKRSAPRKYTISKIKFSSSPQISGRRRGAGGVHTLLPPFNIQNIYPLLTLTVTPAELCFDWN